MSDADTVVVSRADYDLTLRAHNLLNTLLTLSCLGFLSYVLVEEKSRPPTTYNQPVQRTPSPPNGGMKQNNPPPGKVAPQPPVKD